MAPVAADAASQTWSSTPTSGNWGTTTDWLGGAVPGAVGSTTNADIATFNSASTTTAITFASIYDIGGINFDTSAAAYTIGTTGGNALDLTSGGTIQILSTFAGTGITETVNAPLVLEGAAGTYTFANNATSSTDVLNFGGGITGGATGATVLTLSGANTGNNTISGIIANGTATSLAVTKNGASTWDLTGATPTPAPR